MEIEKLKKTSLHLKSNNFIKFEILMYTVYFISELNCFNLLISFSHVTQ